MDENNNTNETGGQPTKENPFKNLNFYAAYFITIIILGVGSWLLTGGRSDDWMIAALFLCIPYGIVGFIAWAIVRNKNRAVALGILFGSITPFVAVFTVTGGCGLFMF